MKAAKRNRWFSFSLRTLFVAVTIAACAAAWLIGQIRLVEQRRAFSETLFTRHGYFHYDMNEIPSLPWWREFLGDDGVQQIRVPFTCESEFRSEAARLFPEAQFLPISKEEMEQDQRDREAQRKEEAAVAEFREHLKRRDWFLNDGAWTRFSPSKRD